MLPFEFYHHYSQVAPAYAGHPQPATTTATRPSSPGTAGRTPGRRRTLLAALSVLLLAAAGIGGAVASGAFHGRTPATHTAPVDSHRHPAAPARHLPPGPRWDTTTTITTPKGELTLTVHAAVTNGATTSPDPAHPGSARVTVPQLAGWYTLTNRSPAPLDLTEPVRVFTYWSVPTGLCLRWNPYWTDAITQNHLPMHDAGRQTQLCPMAFGDSTLPTTTTTLAPGAQVTVDITATSLGVLRQNYPLPVPAADAAVVAAATTTRPAGWLAVDGELTTNPSGSIASTGLAPH